MASSVQTTANQAKAAVADIMEQMNLGSDEFDVALDHDRILLSLRANEFETLTKVARRLIERKPDFRPAWTNLTEALFQLGRLHEALDTAQRTVEKFPESGYAVCNLARLLYISGDQRAAREIADRIPDTADPAGQDVVGKRAELYGLLGDFDAILALDKEVERVSLEPPNAVVLRHMVAVAHSRNGDIENARQEWQKAIAIFPDYDVAVQNLEDLDRKNDVHAPWPLSVYAWVPGVWVDEFTKSNVAADNRIHRFVERHPEFLKLVPALLDRGDPIGRTLALGIACTLRTEQMLEALEAFAFGQYGPDEQRQRALSTLIEEGVVGRGPREVYFDGRWSTILTSVIRISTNVTNPLPLESEPKATRALEAMKSGDFKSAEQLWNELIIEDPDEPSFYNNLGACLEGLGREVG
jgi:Flp pilus assembly protein TadD